MASACSYLSSADRDRASGTIHAASDAGAIGPAFSIDIAACDGDCRSDSRRKHHLSFEFAEKNALKGTKIFDGWRLGFPASCADCRRIPAAFHIHGSAMNDDRPAILLRIAADACIFRLIVWHIDRDQAGIPLLSPDRQSGAGIHMDPIHRSKFCVIVKDQINFPLYLHPFFDRDFSSYNKEAVKHFIVQFVDFSGIISLFMYDPAAGMRLDRPVHIFINSRHQAAAAERAVDVVGVIFMKSVLSVPADFTVTIMVGIPSVRIFRERISLIFSRILLFRAIFQIIMAGNLHLMITAGTDFTMAVFIIHVGLGSSMLCARLGMRTLFP